MPLWPPPMIPPQSPTTTRPPQKNEGAQDSAQVLFQTALIESGYEVADPAALVNRVYRLMSMELGVVPDALLAEVEVPEEEEAEGGDEGLHDGGPERG